MPIETSPILALPYIQAAQAQKHVTHNEAIRLLDIAVQLVVQSRSLMAPPAADAEGNRHIVAAPATGAWAGHDGEIAIYEGGAYWFIAPLPGWRAYVLDEAATATLSQSSVWETGSDLPLEIDRLGVNATPDANNQMILSGASTLFTHDGAGHRVTLNKATVGDTASFLFQTGYDGRAEVGTTGDDDLTIKVSADGSTWVEALRVDGSSGHVTGDAVMASATDTTPGRLMLADYGYGPGNLVGSVAEAAGVPTGAVIETGSTVDGSYTRFADGTQICAQSLTTSGTGVTTWSFPTAFSSAPSCVASAEASLPRFTTTGASSASQIDVDCWDITGTRQAETVHLIAFGRWF
ncbi:DUF2793 domain-containing protein [Cognatishimia sp.]|uniref:DUF2793 domain-containing protein n=1 Tax=Cognatishimia sp. TaxID=2211648 RepID=UPI003512A238|nr:DUF2793 domain-containing protein [Cognatishimia sp.]